MQVDRRVAADPVDVVAALDAEDPGHRRERARRHRRAVVLVGRDVAVLAEGATHVARREENRARALPAAVDELLAGVVEISRDARAGGELASTELLARGAVDLAVPAAEVAVPEHPRGELAAQVEEARARGRGERRPVPSHRFPELEERAGPALELAPEVRLG